MRMLVVDDEESVVEVLRAAAAALGIEEVDVARNAEEALGRAVGQHYDLVTLDLRMPGKNGLEVLNVIRSLCPHAILAVLSGCLPETVDEEIRQAADTFIAKPLGLATLRLLKEAAAQVVHARETVRAISCLPAAAG